MALSLKEVLDSGTFAVTAEITPPKGTAVDETLENIELLKDKVDALNVADNQDAIMCLNPLVVCHLIKERGGEPILQLCCRDRNRLALQSDLLSAHVLGIHNVLCITGDHITLGDHSEAKPVYDLDSVQLLQAIKLLQEGKDMGGSMLKGSAELYAGAIVVPEANPLEPQLLKFEKKVKTGAAFFQTQAVFDMDKFKNFMRYARQFKVKILAGIVFLESADMARDMNDNSPGVSVPENLIEELAGAGKEDARAKGIEIAGRIVKQIKEEAISDGVHIMAGGNEKTVPDILAAAGL
jgi:5,10-methylenetetrahydrofolate reductase